MYLVLDKDDDAFLSYHFAETLTHLLERDVQRHMLLCPRQRARRVKLTCKVGKYLDQPPGIFLFGYGLTLRRVQITDQ